MGFKESFEKIYSPVGVTGAFIISCSIIVPALGLGGGYLMAEGIHHISELDFQRRERLRYEQLAEINEALDKIQLSERLTSVDKLPNLVTD